MWLNLVTDEKAGAQERSSVHAKVTGRAKSVDPSLSNVSPELLALQPSEPRKRGQLLPTMSSFQSSG